MLWLLERRGASTCPTPETCHVSSEGSGVFSECKLWTSVLESGVSDRARGVRRVQSTVILFHDQKYSLTPARRSLRPPRARPAAPRLPAPHATTRHDTRQIDSHDATGRGSRRGSLCAAAVAWTAWGRGLARRRHRRKGPHRIHMAPHGQQRAAGYSLLGLSAHEPMNFTAASRATLAPTSSLAARLAYSSAEERPEPGASA